MSTTDWHLTSHARKRATELGFSPLELLQAADEPELLYRQPSRGPAAAIARRGDVSIAVDLDRKTIITVVLTRPSVWRHGKDTR